MKPPLDRREVEQFRDLVAERLGLDFSEDKFDHLARVVQERMHATRCADFGAYLQRLGSPVESRNELRALAADLTVTETFFYRNSDQLRAFATAVLSGVPRVRSSRRLRVLSAGCASGDEPYSLAIVIREALADVARWDVDILAIDVNPSMLAKAAQGRYTNWALRSTPPEIVSKYFRVEGKEFVLVPEVRGMVRFEERNLIADDPAFWRPQAFDVIFCRNVLMYFTPVMLQKVIANLTGALVPGGFLFLGHAETLRGLSNDYHLCHTHETFYYQRREPGETVSPAEVRGPALLASTATRWQPLGDDCSWVDAIQQASARIAVLATESAPPRHDASSRGPPRKLTSEPPRAARSTRIDAALDLVRQERFDEALELLRALPPESNGDADTLLLLAVLLTNHRALDEAEETCRKLLALDELNAGAHYLMALCREGAGDVAGAAEHDRTAAYLDASFAMPRVHLGLLARRDGNHEAARRELSQALLLLQREDASRLLLFGGGFSREALTSLCRNELERGRTTP